MAVAVETIKPRAGQSFRLLSWDRSIERVRLHTEAGQSIPVDGSGSLWHRHSEMEITCVTEGHGLRLIGNHLEKFTAGDLIIIDRHLPHYWRMDGASHGYCIQFDPEAPLSVWQSGEEIAATLQPLRRAARLGLHITGNTAAEIQSRLSKLATLAALPRFTALLDILTIASQAPPHDTQTLASKDFHLPEPGDPHERAIAAAVAMISGHFHEPLKLSDILDAVPVSRPTFSRHFKRSTGRSFITFLTEIRIANACRELTTSQKSVTQIAEDSGFNDLSHFNRMFRRQMNCSPLAYRRGSHQFR
ncbi:MAG: AraC family transcriptional regulator [Verrucomicrobiales bacterium]|nr:AraC family transcriptional regulator [Verrucomicrobiales bacterium]